MNEKRGRAAIIAAVAVLMLAAVCFVGVGAGSEDVEAADSGTFTVGEKKDYTSLPVAVADAKAADDKTVSLNGDAEVNLSSDLDLTGVTIDCGTFQLNIVGGSDNSVTVTGGIITGEGEGKYASGDLVVNLSNKVNFTGTQFAMTSNGNNPQYAIPFAAITISSAGTIVLDGCSFTCDTDGTFGAIQNSGDLTVKNCQMSSGIITVKAKTTIDGTEGVLLQFVSTMTVDDSKLVLQNGSTIAQTIIGWDDSNSSYDSTHTPTNQIITTITISQDIDLGELRSGNDQYSASKTTAGATINANVTVYGGEGIKTVTINSGKALVVPADETFTATGTVTNNGSIIVNGTLDASDATSVTGSGDITVAGTAKFASDSNITVDALPGSNVTGATSNQIDGEITVNTISEASQYLQTPGMVITYTGTEALTSDIVVGSGVTLKTNDTGAYFNIGTYDIIVDGGRFTGKIHDGTSVISEIDLSGDYTISKGSTEIDGDIYGGSVSSRADDVVVSGNITGEITVKTASRDGANSVIFKDVTFGPNGKVIITGGNVVIDDTFGDVVIDEPTADVTVSVEAGEAYSGNIVYRFTDADGNKKEYIVPVTATAPSGAADLKIVDVDDSENKLTLSGVALQTMTIDEELILSGTNTIPNGVEITFADGGKLVLANGSTLNIYGTLRYDGAAPSHDRIVPDTGATNVTVGTVDKGAVEPYCATSGINYADLSSASDVSDLDGLKTAIENGAKTITLSQNFTDKITGSITLEGVTLYLNGNDLIIGENENSRGTLDIVDSIVYRGISDNRMGNAANSIIVKDYSGLTITNSKVFTTVESDAKSSVEVNNQGVKYEGVTSDVMVGYGTTLVLSADLSSDIDVFGELVIESSVTIAYNSELNVYSAGKLVVNGSLAVNGAANFYDGSEAEINGTVTVSRSEGGASLNVGAAEDGTETYSGAVFTVTSTGAVNVYVQNAGIAQSNSLNVINGGHDVDSTKLMVEGTLTVTGKLTGYIHDKGTVAISGNVAGAGVYLYDGVTITVGKIVGDLTVTDKGVTSSDGRQNVEVSNGNKITLNNIMGVTISEKVSTERWTESGNSYVGYVSVLSMSGIASATVTNNGKIEINNNGIDTTGENDDKYAYVSVGDLTLGQGVELTNYQGMNVVVDGTLNCLAQTSTTTAVVGSRIVNNGTITVNGMIAVHENSRGFTIGTLNAAKYTVTDSTTASNTDYYTAFVTAIEAGDTSFDSRVIVYGNVSAGSDVTIPAGLTVEMNGIATLTVASGATVTLADGSTMKGSNGSVVVYGTFTAQDYKNDLSVKSIVADVVTTEGASRTWTSLAGAIASGATDITLNNVVTITSDLTIPEGVTVTTNIAPGADGYSILVKGAKLTVDGALVMLEKSNGAIKVENTTSKNGEVDVNGVFSARLLAEEFDNTYMNGISGAHYAIMNGAYTVFYVSNVEYAAETVSGNANIAENEDGYNVVIKGVVAATDAEFASAQDMSLSIFVEGGVDADHTAILSMGTLTLTGSTTFIVDETYVRFTGTVEALCGDGTSSASIKVDRGSQIYVGASSDLNAESTEYTVELSSSGAGDVTVTSGTVEVSGYVVGTADGVFTVASGATLVVPSNMEVYGIPGTDYAATFVVDGTIVMDGGLIAGCVSINGTMSVEEDLTLGPDASSLILMYVTGSVDVAEGKTLSLGQATIIMGERPTSLGAGGSMSGTVEFGVIDGSRIVAYAGADLSGADMNINPATGESEVASTTFVINGVEYATVYAVGGTDIEIEDVFVEGTVLEIALSGLQSPYDSFGYLDWYATQQDAERGENPVSAEAIGEYATVYAVFSPSIVEGTVSKDAGIILTIDGLVIGSNGDVSQTITEYKLSVGTHTIAWSERTGYDYSGVTLTFNGQTVENGGTITITADMQSFTIIASGAVPSQGGQTGGDDGLGLTDYLLIILVVLIVVMAIMVAMRLMRS